MARMRFRQSYTFGAHEIEIQKYLIEIPITKINKCAYPRGNLGGG